MRQLAGSDGAVVDEVVVRRWASRRLFPVKAKGAVEVRTTRLPLKRSPVVPVTS